MARTPRETVEEFFERMGDPDERGPSASCSPTTRSSRSRERGLRGRTPRRRFSRSSNRATSARARRSASGPSTAIASSVRGPSTASTTTASGSRTCGTSTSTRSARARSAGWTCTTTSRSRGGRGVSDASNEETADRVGVLFALRDEPALVVRAEQLGTRRVGRGGTGEVGVRQAGALGGPHRADRARDGDRQRVLADAGRDRAGGRDPRRALGRPRGPRARRRPPGRRRGVPRRGVRAPLPRMAEYIELVRRYLRGDPEGYDGEFFSPSRTAFWEAFAPERASIPIYNGALGPGNVRLTGQFADGWVPNLYPDSQFKEAKGGSPTARPAATGTRRRSTWRCTCSLRSTKTPSARVGPRPNTLPTTCATSRGTTTAPPWRRGSKTSSTRSGTPLDGRRRGASRDRAPRSPRGRRDSRGGAGPTGPPPRDRRRPPDRPGPAGSDREWVERTLEAFAPSR